MADPRKPDDPPRRIVDEKVVRRTDPRLRGDAPKQAPPAPAFLGLPGQPAPSVFSDPLQSETEDNSPTVTDFDVSALRERETARPSPPPPSAPDPVPSRRATGLQVVPAAKLPVPSAPLDPPVEAPRRFEPLDPPVAPLRPPTGRIPLSGPLDPPMPPARPATSPRVPVGGLDPPMEPQRPSPRLGALDPPMEPARKRVSTEVRAVDAPAPAAAAATTPKRELPLRAIAAGVFAVALIALVFRGPSSAVGSRTFGAADVAKLTALWVDKSSAPFGGVRADDDVTRTVAAVGTPLAERMGLAPAPHFFVLNDEIAAQCFTLPDGSVAITVGALRRLGSEAQLAAVLAHGLAHAKTGDVARRLDGAENAAAVAEQVAAGELGDAAIELSSLAVTTPNSTAAEMRADHVAAAALRDAGFADSALADAVRNFGVRGGGRRAAWLHQHPDGGGRLEALSQLKGEGTTGEREYDRVLDKIGRLPAQRGTARTASTTTASTASTTTTTPSTTTTASTTASTATTTTTPTTP